MVELEGKACSEADAKFPDPSSWRLGRYVAVVRGTGSLVDRKAFRIGIGGRDAEALTSCVLPEKPGRANSC